MGRVGAGADTGRGPRRLNGGEKWWRIGAGLVIAPNPLPMALMLGGDSFEIDLNRSW